MYTIDIQIYMII